MVTEIFVIPRTVVLFCPWNSPGKNTRVSCHSLLQGIFLTQGSNPVSCTAGRFFTVWATKEAQLKSKLCDLFLSNVTTQEGAYLYFEMI